MKANVAQRTALCSSLVLLLTAGNSVAVVPGLKQQIPAAEYAALVDLYTSTQGPSWNNHDGWNDPAAPSWYGVGVSGFQYDSRTGQILSVGTVTALELVYNNLHGIIPDSLGNLVHLEDLRLGPNQLNGSIPDSLGNLVNLRNLLLYYNHLTGSIPDSLGRLMNLVYIYLNSNQLSGNIPDTFGSLTRVQSLDLHLERNQLSGSIPDTFGNLVNVPSLTLELSYNQLSGGIPNNFRNLNLFSLGVADNQLSGNIPDFSGIAHLEFFFLSQNCFDISPGSQAWTIIDKMIQAGKQVTYEPQKDDCGPGPLVLTCPADLSVPKEAEECSAVVHYLAPVPSGGVGPYTVVCNPLSASVFPTGATTVHCTATDAAGHTATCSFTATVDDAEPPIITCRPDLTVQCLRDVPPPNFTGSVTDNCDPNPVVTHVGDVAVGRNPIHITRTYWATDTSGNAASCSQIITVQGLAGGFDLNGDCCVDRTDLNLLMDKIRARSTDLTYDHNGDGKVDVADARFLVMRFTNPGGAPCGSP